MRKSLWIMLAVMVVAVSAPNAHADTFTYGYTDTSDGISWTTGPIAGVTMQTTVPAADLTATSNTGSLTGCVTTAVILDYFGTGATRTEFAGCPPLIALTFSDGFALTDYTTPGTYTGAFGTLVVKSAVATPEPSSVALMLLGLASVLLLRKRIFPGHQLAL